MAGQESAGGRPHGYDGSVQAVSRQRKGRVLYRLLIFLAILLVFAAFLVWSYFMARASARPWVFSMVLLGVGVSTTLLIRLLGQLQVEGDRVSTLEDREAKVQFFADRQAQAHARDQIDMHISARQEAESFERVMDSLSSATQEKKPLKSTPDEDTENGLREALAHTGVLAQYLDRLIRTLHDRLRPARSKSLSAGTPLEISSGEPELTTPPEDQPSPPKPR